MHSYEFSFGLRWLYRLIFLYFNEFQVQVVDEGAKLLMDLRGEVFCDGGEGRVSPGIGCPVPADEPVCNVDVCLLVFLCSEADEKICNLDVKVWEILGFLLPGVEAVDIREGCDGAAGEDGQPVVELGLSAGGQPDKLGDKPGADDGGLLGFDDGHGLLREEGQKVFAEQALGKRPVLGQLPGILEHGMDPGDAAFGVLVLDAVAGLRVVFHNLTGTDATLDIYLEEDDVLGTCDAQLVFLNEALDGYSVKKCSQELYEVGVVIQSD